MKYFILLFFPFLFSCTSASEQQLDVLCFNIRYGTANDGDNHWLKRKQMLFKVIKNYSADVVGLQEALDFQIKEIKSAVPGYASIGFSREGKDTTRGEHCTILYKKDKYTLVEHETFWLSDTPEKVSTSWGNKLYRICTKVVLKEKKTGKSFYIYNTHFDHRSKNSKEKSAEFLVEKISSRKKKHPFVFMGDLNSAPQSKQIKHIQENEKLPMADTHFIANPDDKDAGTSGGWTFGNHGSKIDYIYIEKDAGKVLKAEINRYSENKRYPSDHFPVFARIVFNQ